MANYPSFYGSPISEDIAYHHILTKLTNDPAVTSKRPFCWSWSELPLFISFLHCLLSLFVEFCYFERSHGDFE